MKWVFPARTTARPLAWLAWLSFVAFVAAIAGPPGCGGTKTGPTPPSGGSDSSDGGARRDGARGPSEAAAGEPLHLTVDAPNVPMPGPFALGSKLASTRAVPGSDACGEATKAAGTDPGAEASRRAKACAAATKTHPLGSALRGRGSASSPAVSFPLSGKAGKCYRFYAAAETGVSGFSAMVLDGAGAVAAEGHAEAGGTAIAPSAGLVCFDKPDPSARVVVSVGTGSGAFAVEVWTDE